MLSSVDSQDDPDVALVEMVLEPYFMHIDNTYNKVKGLMEYVGDTEVRAGAPVRRPTTPACSVIRSGGLVSILL